MQKYLLLKVLGAGLLAFVTAVGYALDITQVGDIGNNWWPLITFVIFFLLVVWIIFGLYRQVFQLMDNRPSITVEPIIDGNIYYLKVKNDGSEGIYKAQLHLTSEDPSVWQLADYIGYWRFGNNSEARILEGQYDCIKIAELCTSSSGLNSQHLNIWFFDKSVNYAHHCSTSSYWGGATIVSPDGTSRPMTKHEYNLSVTISTSPSLKERVFQENYVLTFHGLQINNT